MAEGSGSGFSKKQMGICAEKVDKELKIIDAQLKILHDSLVKCMSGGEGGTALWNGADALTFYKKATGNIDNNLEDYERAYKMAQTLAVASETSN